jgi:hypothetical protein
VNWFSSVQQRSDGIVTVVITGVSAERGDAACESEMSAGIIEKYLP